MISDVGHIRIKAKQETEEEKKQQEFGEKQRDKLLWESIFFETHKI